MPKLRRVSGQKAVRALEQLGFVQVRQRGSHVVLKKQISGGEIGCVVPLHSELAIGTLRGILRKANVSPDEFMGTVIGDISSKRAQILGTEKRGKVSIIVAMVPLAELSGYATTLRSVSQGRATYYMEPSHYEEVPKNITEKIVASVSPTSTRG